jgi:hypothetical protein
MVGSKTPKNTIRSITISENTFTECDRSFAKSQPMKCKTRSKSQELIMSQYTTNCNISMMNQININ